jgi:lipopolysaccharide/colanic/teichoic acid biosynthesis glycosyltransferase
MTTRELTLQVRPASEPHFAYDFLKRAFDILVASFLILVTLPITIPIAFLLRIKYGPPVFFGQLRMGKCGTVFVCWKFRTMVQDAEARRDEVLHLNTVDGPAFKATSDPRITTVGRWLRHFSIDELPQLYNVLKGEMSLVGPRPLPVVENRYQGDQAYRLSVKPGLTCIWQISGRSQITFDQWMALDLDYVRSRSLWLDLRLVLKTVPAVIASRGAM